MSVKASAGRIDTYDVEEQIQAAQPWEVILRQMSPGKFHARMEYVHVNGIILYREHMSHRLMATAATPAGYFTFGGPSLPGTGIDWCGGQINHHCLAYAPMSTEVDFILPEHSDHCVLLVPNDLLLQHLSEELVATLLSSCRHHLTCHQGFGDELIGMIGRLVDKYLANSELLADERVCKAIESQLLETVAQLIRPAAGTVVGCKPPANRRLAFRRAIEYAESLKQPITVPEFATAAGVDRRVLEMAFQETLGNSPLQYLRRRRLNFVHREMLSAEPDASSVTEIATRWGFSELGRFAVEYKRLFGESPSATLKTAAHTVPKQLADSLLE